MSHKKPYKHHKKGAGRFVQLPEWLQATEAWATMEPGPRALYMELKRRYNGNNNGKITMSYREAALAINKHRNSVGAYFKVLEDRGFIHPTKKHCLGPSGVGQTTHWALDELPTFDGVPARKAFASWKPKQKPRTKSVTPRHKNRDASDGIDGTNASTVPKTVTQSQVSDRKAAQE